MIKKKKQVLLQKQVKELFNLFIKIAKKIITFSSKITGDSLIFGLADQSYIH